MNPARSEPLDYINFLVAAQKSFTCSEAARCQPDAPGAPAHDAFTRLLRRQPPGTEALWRETQGLVQREGGVLVLDGTTLDKPYARKMELVTRHWSGKHRRVVAGINLLTLLWTDGHALIPCDFESMTSRLAERTRTITSGRWRLWPTGADSGQPGPFRQLVQQPVLSLPKGEAGAGMRLGLADSIPLQPPGEPRWPGQCRVDAVEIPPEGTGGPICGLRIRQGVSDGLPKRRRGTLGRQ